MKNIPNFLIVGAAKSGTTTINYYLDKHEEVFMTEPKEPKFFSYKYSKYTGPGDSSFTEKRAVKSLENYYNLFSNSNGKKCIGEASVDNLFYCSKVIPDIKKELNDPKIVIFLRHPVDRAVSAYSHLIRDGREELSFNEALEKEEERLQEGYEFIWGYKEGGLYYKQVKEYLDNFSKVKVYLFDDLISDPQNILDDLTSFLGISKTSVIEDLKLNISGKPKNKLLNMFVSRDTSIRRVLTKIVGKDTAIKIKNLIQKRNLNKIVIPEAQKKDLAVFFKEDTLKLQELLQRDLSSWINKY